MIEGPRATRPEELEEVGRLVNLVFRGSESASPSMREYYPLLLGPANLENMRIVLEDGRAVCHLGIREGEIWVHGLSIKVGSIGSVATHPDHRRKGYATMLLHDAFDRIRQRGGDLVIISGTHNIYRHQECHPTGRYLRAAVKRGQTQARFATEINVRPAGEGDLTALTACYWREPVRFYRPAEDFGAFLAAAGTTNVRVDTISCKGEMIGYLAYWIQEEKSGIRKAIVKEYAGCRAAMPAAATVILEKEKLDGMEFTVPAHDLGMKMALGLTGKSEPLHGHTFKVLDFPRMMEGLTPHLRACLGKAFHFDFGGEVFRFRSGETRFEVGGQSELLAFLFGEMERPPAWREVFPVPLPAPGFNYV